MPGRSNGGVDRKTLHYFSENSYKENEMRAHSREKRFGETGLISILSVWNDSSENSPNSIACFVLFLHPVVKPLGMNVTIFSLILIPKSRPYVIHTDLKQ